MLEKLNQTQLRFEAYKRMVGAHPTLFEGVDGMDSKNVSVQLQKELKDVETYLNKVVQEYESALRYGTDEEHVLLSRLPAVRAFIFSKKGPDQKASAKRAGEKVSTPDYPGMKRAAKKSFESALERLTRITNQLS